MVYVHTFSCRILRDCISCCDYFVVFDFASLVCMCFVFNYATLSLISARFFIVGLRVFSNCILIILIWFWLIPHRVFAFHIYESFSRLSNICVSCLILLCFHCWFFRVLISGFSSFSFDLYLFVFVQILCEFIVWFGAFFLSSWVYAHF